MNKLHILGRVLAGFVALFVLVSGLGMMFNPTGLLGGLALTPDGVVGYSSLRGLIGGSQVAFGIVFAYAAWRGRAEAIFLGVLYFGAVVVGRIIGLGVDGVEPFSIRATVFASVFLFISLGSFTLLRRKESIA